MHAILSARYLLPYMYKIVIVLLIAITFIRCNISDFSKCCSVIHLKNHHSSDVNIKKKNQLKRSSRMDYKVVLYDVVAYVYTVLCKLNFNYRNQSRFHLYFLNIILFSCNIWHGSREKHEIPFDTEYLKL